MTTILNKKSRFHQPASSIIRIMDLGKTKGSNTSPAVATKALLPATKAATKAAALAKLTTAEAAEAALPATKATLAKLAATKTALPATKSTLAKLAATKTALPATKSTLATAKTTTAATKLAAAAKSLITAKASSTDVGTGWDRNHVEWATDCIRPNDVSRYVTTEWVADTTTT
jgi:hypothetical protein